VRHKDYGTTLLQHLLDGWDSGTNTSVIGYLTLAVERHIEIHADNGAFARKVVIVNCEHNFLFLSDL
jgi:hypothetical protein